MRARSPWGPLAGVLVAAVLLGTVAGEAAPRLALVIDAGTLRAEQPIRGWTGLPPSLADVTGDGRLELLAQNENGHVYVIDTATGLALAELTTRHPYDHEDVGPFNGPRAADVTGDGRAEIVNVNREAVVSVWAVDPVNRTEDGRLVTTLLWDRHLNEHHGQPTADAGPAIGDVTGDGRLEIVTQTEERGVFALTGGGELAWSLDIYGGNAEARLVDVTGDGVLDAVFFSDGGAVTVVDGPTGDVVWRFESRPHGVWPGSAARPGVVTDVDGDGRVDVVYCMRNVENATPDHAPGAPYYHQHHFALASVTDGELNWLRKPGWGNPLCSSYLMGADVTGDGRLEIFGMDWNTIGHKPGNWEHLGDAHAFAFDADGNALWHRGLDPFNAKPTITMGDWTGDGRPDVVAYADGRLVILDAVTGKTLASVWLDGWDVKQGALLADVDGDGNLDAVVGVSGKSHAFLVYDVGVPFTEPVFPGWDAPVLEPRGARIGADPDPEDPGDGADGGGDGERGTPGGNDSGTGEEPDGPPPARRGAAAPGVLAVLGAAAAAAATTRRR